MPIAHRTAKEVIVHESIEPWYGFQLAASGGQSRGQRSILVHKHLFEGSNSCLECPTVHMQLRVYYLIKWFPGKEEWHRPARRDNPIAAPKLEAASIKLDFEAW